MAVLPAVGLIAAVDPKRVRSPGGETSRAKGYVRKLCLALAPLTTHFFFFCPCCLILCSSLRNNVLSNVNFCLARVSLLSSELFLFDAPFFALLCVSLWDGTYYFDSVIYIENE